MLPVRVNVDVNFQLVGPKARITYVTCDTSFPQFSSISVWVSTCSTSLSLTLTSFSCASYFSSSPSHLDAIDPLRRGLICSDLLRYVSPRAKLEHFQSPQSCNPLPFFCLSPPSLDRVRLAPSERRGSRWTTGILPARLCMTRWVHIMS